MKTKADTRTLEDDADVGQTEAMKLEGEPSNAPAAGATGAGEDEAPQQEGHGATTVTAGGGAPESAHADADLKAAKASRRVSADLKTLVAAGLISALLAATGVMTWLYLRERSELQAEQRQAADNQHAEQIALDYAVDAAKVNFQDLNAWKDSLVRGTAPHLTDKLTKAATQMRQLFIPLEWNSDATPLTAKVRSHTDGVYVVDAFVSVSTKTTQMPESVPSTATYSISIDSKDNWQISDVGGIGALAGPK